MKRGTKASTQSPLANADMNHIHINVKDQERSQHFYERFFGFKLSFIVPAEKTSEMRKDIRFLENADGFQLGLDCHPDRRDLPDWFHLGFRLKTADAVRQARKFLIANEVSVSDDFIDTKGYVSFVCQDPDGYHLEIFYDDPND